AARMPKPPAALVAAVRRAPETHPMPVCTIGRSQPTRSQNRVRSRSDTPSDYGNCQCRRQSPGHAGGVDVPGSADVVVVGAGIAGASAAWAIAERGASVVVLEAEATAGHHATGRSAALLMETYGSAPVIGLVRASRPFIESPPEGFADHPLTAPRGVLWIGRLGGPADRLRGDAAGWSAPPEVLDLGHARQLV